MSTTSILPCPPLTPTDEAVQALAHLLDDVERAGELINRLNDYGMMFDAGIAVRSARSSLLQALQALCPDDVVCEVA